MDNVKVFKDENLKSIKIVDSETKEIYAFLNEDGTVLNNKKVLVILNYNDEEKDKNIIEKDGKFYWRG